MKLSGTQARRFARHPEHRSERVATGNHRITWLGDADHQPMRQTPIQQLANELIAAEQAFAEIQTRYVRARRAASEELRVFGASGAQGSGQLESQYELDTAERVRDLTMKRVEDLRQELHQQRRLALVSGELATTEPAFAPGDGQTVEPPAAQGSAPGSSLFGRLLRVGGR